MADYYRDMEEESMFSNSIEVNHFNPKPYKWWGMADGSRIEVAKMTDKHLINCINKIDRDQWRLQWKEPLMLELESRK